MHDISTLAVFGVPFLRPLMIIIAAELQPLFRFVEPKQRGACIMTSTYRAHTRVSAIF